jgi:hypothetical protein
MIYWRFKNHDATRAFWRFTIRLTSIFICFKKTRKTWKLAFISTLDCTSIIDRWITFSTTYARFVSRWRIINESKCTMFIMSHSIFYTTRNALIVIKIVKNCLNNDEKHILLKNFNLHHSLWNDATRSIQHDATDQFLNVVQQTQFKFILFSNIIIWKTRHFQNTIDLIFMTKKLQKKFIHCMTRSKMNQSSDHISIFTKLKIIVKKNKSRRRRAWKNMSTNKLLNNWRELVASSSFNCIAQVEAYALEIQQCVLRSIKIFVSWANFFFEIKFFWNEKCAETITTTKRRRRK